MLKNAKRSGAPCRTTYPRSPQRKHRRGTNPQLEDTLRAPVTNLQGPKKDPTNKPALPALARALLQLLRPGMDGWLTTTKCSANCVLSSPLAEPFVRRIVGDYKLRIFTESLFCCWAPGSGAGPSLMCVAASGTMQA